ncbi:transcriptional regulator [Archangium violaceum]|uniref:transcriptional regulator n=1 Tax=Archangium violaceum TaxID=83451 RepID=UPI00193C0C2F|nr:transcriptional regulator [Archangium violaceum]QRK09943.1 transcriptional regulator [Archangium violaceum]
MAAKWDKQLMDFIKRTGEELKRTGDELRTEAQKLLVEVKDPAKQAKVKEGLENLRTWAVATGKQAAERLETAARHVEETIEKTFDNREVPTSAEPQPPPAAPTRSTAQTPEPEPQPRAAKKAAARTGTQKSIGRKKTAAKAPAKTPAKKAAARTGTQKSIGRKKPARPTS